MKTGGGSREKTPQTRTNAAFSPSRKFLLGGERRRGGPTVNADVETFEAVDEETAVERRRRAVFEEAFDGDLSVALRGRGEVETDFDRLWGRVDGDNGNFAARNFQERNDRRAAERVEFRAV